MNRSKVIEAVLVTLAFIVLFAVVFGVRYWMASGDMSCVLSTDPAICAAINR